MRATKINEFSKSPNIKKNQENQQECGRMKFKIPEIWKLISRAQSMLLNNIYIYIYIYIYICKDETV